MASAFSECINHIWNCDIKRAEIIFAHAWGDLKEESIKKIYEIWKKSGAEFIALNGLNEYEKGDKGFSHWKYSLAQLGISEEKIISLGIGKNTQEEARLLADFILKKGIKEVIVYSVPQHILRAFLTDLEVLENRGFRGKIYPYTLNNVDWEEKIAIHPILGDPEKLTRLGRFADEIFRIIEYRNRYDKGDHNFTIANVEKGLGYLKGLHA